MLKRNFLLSILVVCVGSTVPRTLWAQETLGVSLPLSSYGAFTGTNDNNSVVDTLVTPFAATQSGWITSWEAQFYPGVYNGICYPPLGIQLKVLRPTAPNILTVVSAGNVFDPLALLQARFNTTGCPSFNMDASSVLQFTEPASLQVLAGDVIGLTVTGNSTAPPNTLAYVIPTGASQSNTRVVIQNVPVGGTIDLSNPIVGTLPSLENAVQVQVGDQPSPVLVFTGSNNYVGSDGNTYTSYNLSVSNWQLYDPALFTLTSAYGPCGLNDTPSRTWVDIYDQNSNRIYGFCALNSPYGLTQIWFAEPVGTPPPAGVYVVLTDRSTTPYTTYTSNLLPMSLGATPNGYSPIAEPLVPSGGTNPYQFSSNLFNYKVTYPALVSPPPNVDLVLQPILISQSDLIALVAGTGFQGAQLVLYDGTGGYGVLFRATCQDHTTTVPVPCPDTSGPYDVKTSWDSTTTPEVSAFLTAPVGTHNWQNIFKGFSQTRIDPTVSGRTCCHTSDFVFVDLGTSVGPAPSITINTPQPSAVYVLNQNVLAGYYCSGPFVVSCFGNVPSGSAIDTSSLGNKTFEVSANVSSGPSADQTVNYQVVLPTLTISPSSVNFGNVHLGLPAVQTVTLTNTGSASITITSVAISKSGNDPDDFKALSLCPSTLAAGKSCPILVTFTADGDNYSPSGTLIITDSAAGSPQSVPLRGTVINPKASLSSYSLNFGKQRVGTTSAAQTVTLTNTGTTSLTLSTLNIGSDFSFATGTTCTSGETLAAGASCLISVNFTPTAKGARLGSVTIKDNALLKEQIIVLFGTGY